MAKDFRADVLVVMLAEPDAAARRMHDSVRERSGVRVMHVGEHPLDALPLLRHVRGGGVVAIQLGPCRPGWTLLGRGAVWWPGTHAGRAVSAGCLVWRADHPIFAHRRGYFRYEFTVAAPIRCFARRRRSSCKALRPKQRSACSPSSRVTRPSGSISPIVDHWRPSGAPLRVAS